MRKRDLDPPLSIVNSANTNAAEPTKTAQQGCGLGIVTGTRNSELTEHARALSNQTLEPVVQYVYATAGDQPALLRRHWLAGHAPNVVVVAHDPACVGCAITADLKEFTAEHDPRRIAAMLPAGTDATHMAAVIDGDPQLHVRYVRAIVNGDSLTDELACADDLHLSDMVSWSGDQRWVAHTVIGLLAAADQVLLHGDRFTSEVPALVQHLNNVAQVHLTTSGLADTSVTFGRRPSRNERAGGEGSSSELVHGHARRRTRGDGQDQPQGSIPVPKAGVRTSRLTDATAMHPERLLSAVTDIADHVVRVDGCIRLASQPDRVYRLHVSAGMASLDPIGEYVRSDRHHPQCDPREIRNDLIVTTREPDTGNCPHNTVIARLRSAILVPAEVGLGPTEWRTFPDPFAR
jgi:G3E family GTPase